MLSTYPLEHLAASRARVNPESTWRIYRALAQEARATLPVSVADPRVVVDALEHADGTRFVWLVNAAADELKVRPQVAAGTLATLDGEPVGETVALAPYGVSVLRHNPTPATTSANRETP